MHWFYYIPKKQKLKTQKCRIYFSKLKSNYYTKDHIRLWAYRVKRNIYIYIYIVSKKIKGSPYCKSQKLSEINKKN